MPLNQLISNMQNSDLCDRQNLCCLQTLLRMRILSLLNCYLVSQSVKCISP